MPAFIGKVWRFFVDILAIIGLLIIVSQLFLYVLNDQVFLFDEAAVYYNNYNDEGIDPYFSIFIAQILPTTILPFVFMFLSGRRRRWMKYAGIILLLFMITIRAKDIERVQRYKNAEEQRLYELKKQNQQELYK